MLLPEFMIQPVAWSVALLVIVSLLLGKVRNKKTVLGWLLFGLVVGYVVSAALQWQFWLLDQIALYVGLLIAGLLLLLGLIGVFDFFDKNQVKLQPKLTDDLRKLKVTLTRAKPAWIFGLIGFFIGMIEPLRLPSSGQDELFLLLAQPSIEAVLSLSSLLLLALLPLVLILVIGWLVAKRLNQSNKNQRLAIQLYGSGVVIVASWLLATAAAGLL